MGQNVDLISFIKTYRIYRPWAILCNHSIDLTSSSEDVGFGSSTALYVCCLVPATHTRVREIRKWTSQIHGNKLIHMGEQHVADWA